MLDAESDLFNLNFNLNVNMKKSYLKDMREIMEKDECSYQNPFGEDAREIFSDNYAELTKMEQRDFFKSQKSLEEKR